MCILFSVSNENYSDTFNTTNLQHALSYLRDFQINNETCNFTAYEGESVTGYDALGRQAYGELNVNALALHENLQWKIYSKDEALRRLENKTTQVMILNEANYATL